MRFRLFRYSLFITVFLAISCQDGYDSSDGRLSIEYYASLRDSLLIADDGAIRKSLRSLAADDVVKTFSDRFTKDYYDAVKKPFWISRVGVCSQADTLLTVLSNLEKDGLDSEPLRLSQIERDMKRVRNLDFTEKQNVAKVFARLEYNLTKAYLYYASVMSFGFTNPNRLYNRLDHVDNDSTGTHFRELYGIPTKHVSHDFLQQALKKVSDNHFGDYIRSLRPQDIFYDELAKELQAASLKESRRMKILCTMERLRWHTSDHPYKHKKYVLVNLPGFFLNAVDGDQIVSMKIGAGAMRTKTPLLISRLKRIDFNPQWIIPRSIVNKDISHHAGDSEYFSRHNYFVRNKKTGQRLNIEELTSADLRSGDNYVIQEGGSGNALGRIIFRFDNNYSVYLHHTSTPGVFDRADRSVSHGCVRVEKPYELARFLLKDQYDEELLQNIQYTITADLKSPSLSRGKILHSVKVEPQIPLFITYFTIYRDPITKTLKEYPDVYGYDQVLYNQLKWHLKRRP